MINPSTGAFPIIEGPFDTLSDGTETRVTGIPERLQCATPTAEE
jgi:hypothetical protein